MELLTPVQVAALLRISRRSVLRLVEAGALPALRLGRHVRIRAADVATLVATGKPPAPQPPLVEVLAFWRSCGDVRGDAAVTDWLEREGLSPDRVHAIDLARALPDELPVWAGTWAAWGHRLVLPVVDGDGQLASVRGVSVRNGSGAWPAAATTRGLVLAAGLGLSILRPASSPPEDQRWTLAAARERGIRVTSSERVFLQAHHAREAEDTGPLVIGAWAESWDEAIAARMPDGAHVTVDDAALGDRLRSSLSARIARGALVVDVAPRDEPPSGITRVRAGGGGTR